MLEARRAGEMKPLALAAGLLFSACDRSDGRVPVEASTRRLTLVTGAGMCGLWRPSAYAEVDETNWGQHFVANEAIERHVARGEFVPLYLHADGAFAVELRVARSGATDLLTRGERKRVRAVSDPYLFVSEGVVNASGIEHVRRRPPEDMVGSISLPNGRWTVVVYLMSDADEGLPPGEAFPDFIVTFGPEAGPIAYRTSVETFASREPGP